MLVFDGLDYQKLHARSIPLKSCFPVMSYFPAMPHLLIRYLASVKSLAFMRIWEFSQNLILGFVTYLIAD